MFKYISNTSWQQLSFKLLNVKNLKKQYWIYLNVPLKMFVKEYGYWIDADYISIFSGLCELKETFAENTNFLHAKRNLMIFGECIKKCKRCKVFSTSSADALLRETDCSLKWH